MALKKLNKTFDIVFILFIVICLLIAIVPFIFKVKLYVIASGSMKPNMNVGDLVVCKKVDFKNLNEGDVISYKKNDIIITHRIMAIEENEIITKGDNNDYEDNSKVINDQILGKVILTIPFIGYIISFINKFSLVICLAIIIFGCLLNYLNSKSKK